MRKVFTPVGIFDFDSACKVRWSHLEMRISGNSDRIKVYLYGQKIATIRYKVVRPPCTITFKEYVQVSPVLLLKLNNSIKKLMRKNSHLLISFVKNYWDSQYWDPSEKE